MAGGAASTPRQAGTLSYLALGDSYTIGEGVDPGARWPLVSGATSGSMNA